MIAAAAMFAVKVPPKLICSVNRAVMLPLITLTPVTLGPLVAAHSQIARLD